MLSAREREIARKQSKLLKTLRIVFGVLFIAAVVLGGVLFYRWTHSLEQQSELRNREETFLRELNQDYIGWLTVYGTDLTHPVVQGEDNTYYLKHNFYHLMDSSGCLFMDHRVDTEAEGHYLIWGRYLSNGTMMGSLSGYLDLDYFREHNVVEFVLNGEDLYYEIFAVLVNPGYSEQEGYIPIEDYINDIGEDATEALVGELRARAVYWRDLDLDGTDHFLFLMTTDYTEERGRMLLCARLLDT